MLIGWQLLRHRLHFKVIVRRNRECSEVTLEEGFGYANCSLIHVLGVPHSPKSVVDAIEWWKEAARHGCDVGADLTPERGFR